MSELDDQMTAKHQILWRYMYFFTNLRSYPDNSFTWKILIPNESKALNRLNDGITKTLIIISMVAKTFFYSGEKAQTKT